ncbi:MAG: hypothetical protein WA484_00710 [Solirubrobacteraceae bacterium]
MTRGNTHRHDQDEHDPRREAGHRSDVTATLAAELAPEIVEFHAQITGSRRSVDRALLAQLLSDEDCRAGPGALRARLSSFVACHGQRVRRIHRDYLDDPRRPGVLDDACCLLIFDDLNRDRFSLRSRWPATREETELRQLAAIWAKPIS